MTNILSQTDINIDSEGNPLLEGGYAPVEREIEAGDLKTTGDMPADIAGTYVRNGPNPRFQPRGRYHLFDGDGMLHSATLADGKVTYRNRWIRTEGFEAERREGKSIWPGLMEMPDRDLPRGWGSHHWLKDAANTDIVPHNGRLLTTYYQCGVPYIIDAATLETEGPMDVEGLKIRQVSAHSRTDLSTGEFMFFDYNVTAPYMTYGVLDADGKLAHFTDIELPGPRLPHDMAITPTYSVLMDLPLFWNESLLERDIHKVEFHEDMPSRFAILPRHGGNADIKWFEADPAYIYHVINCWEEGDEVVLDVCRMRTPAPDESKIRGGPYAALVAWANMDAQHYRYRFNMKTGETREHAVDDQFIEFPTINQTYQGQKTRHSWHGYIPQGETLRLGGLVHFDAETNKRDEYHYGAGVYGSEPVFAPRIGAKHETDGYVMNFVSDHNEGGRTELHIFDPENVSDGPIARAEIPQRIPVGFHACWMDASGAAA